MVKNQEYSLEEDTVRIQCYSGKRVQCWVADSWPSGKRDMQQLLHCVAGIAQWECEKPFDSMRFSGRNVTDL